MALAVSPTAALIAEIEQEGASTRRLLERLPTDRLAWRPHARSFTMGQLGQHIAAAPGQVVGMIELDEFDFAAADFSTPQPASREAVLAEHDAGLASAVRTLAGWDQATLDGTWTVRKNGAETMRMPRAAALRMLACSHIYHHRGQLGVYLRLCDIPVPAIYGPSADENPFD